MHSPLVACRAVKRGFRDPRFCLVALSLCAGAFPLALHADSPAPGQPSAVVATGPAAVGSAPAEGSTAGVPVTLDGRPLFLLHRPIGSFSTAERAGAVTARIEALARDSRFDPAALAVVEGENRHDLVAGDRVILSVGDADAVAAGAASRAALADTDAAVVRDALLAYRERRTPRNLLLGGVYAALSLLALLALFALGGRVFPALLGRLEGWRGTRMPAVRLGALELLSSGRLTDALLWVVRAIRVILSLALLYFFVPLVLSYFPWTAALAGRLVGYATAPAMAAVHAIAGYLPSVFFIAVIAFVTRYLLQFIHFVFNEVGKGTLVFDGFHAEWAEPTYKITRLLVLAFAAVMIFPYLPGAGSPAFQGISVFFGVLISFGSSSAVSNMVAGIVLTYMRPFRIGDRVRIADTTGDVVERSLLVTRVRTIKNEDITIPNSMVLGSHIVNYSSSAKDKGLILHATVTIGYDAPWRRVHELMIGAALSVEGVLREPAPFVLQTGLEDSYVSYEINAFTDQPARMAHLYSALRAALQDKFNEAGVEIMSPLQAAVRDGNRAAMPDAYLPGGYEAPGFRVVPADPDKPGAKS